MKVIFTIRDWCDLDAFRHPESVSDDPENYQRCVARERGVEIDTCSRIGVDVLYAMRIGQSARTTGFHRELGAFAIFSNDRMAATGSGQSVLIRSHCNDEEKAIEAAMAAGFRPILDAKASVETLRWIDWVKPEFLGRKIVRMTMEDAVSGKAAEVASRVFVKTEDKRLHGECDASDVISLVGYDYEILPLRTPFLVSEVMEIESDTHGKKEWRAWIANGVATSFSRYLDYITDYDTPAAVEDFACRFIASHPSAPRAYVLDICETRDGPKMVECNPVQSSGRYGRNDFAAFLKALPD